MRLVYMDEAGISNPKHEPWVVVAGVIIDADKKLTAVKRHLQNIVERHIPLKFQEDFVFHAKELFNGGGKTFKRLPKGHFGPEEFPLERRLRIADEIANVVAKFALPFVIGAIKRDEWPSASDPATMTEQDRKIGPIVTAHIVCSLHIDHWMRSKTANEVCLLVVEDNDEFRGIIRGTQAAYKNPVHFDGGLRAHFPFRKIVEDPLFQGKKPFHPLQLADFIAYIVKRLLQDDDNRYHRWLQPIGHLHYEVDKGAVEAAFERRARMRQRIRPPQASERST